MKEMLGRLISKTATKTWLRTRGIDRNYQGARERTKRAAVSLTGNAEHNEEQMLFRGMSAALILRNITCACGSYSICSVLNLLIALIFIGGCLYIYTYKNFGRDVFFLLYLILSKWSSIFGHPRSQRNRSLYSLCFFLLQIVSLERQNSVYN